MLTLLVTVGVLAGAMPCLGDSGQSATEPSFDAAQYKEYLTNLKCPEIEDNHPGIKVPEVGGIIYQPTPSPEPIPFQPTPLPPDEPSLPDDQASLPSGHPSLPLGLSSSTGEPSFSAPRPSVTEKSTSSSFYPTYVPSTDKTNSSQSDGGLLSDDKHVNKRTKRQQHLGMADRNTRPPIALEKVIPFQGVVDTVAGMESGNDTSPNSTSECTAPLREDWSNYNWYQVLLDNGGPPGAYLQKGLKSNLIKVMDPCARPVTPVPPFREKITFGFTHTKFEKVHRTEQVQVMFPGTPHEFIDVTGRLVWAPPNSTRRYFHLKYRKDDTGLFFGLNDREKCVFVEDMDAHDVRVDCVYSPLICDCYMGQEICYPPIVPISGLSPALEASLIGKR